MVLFPYFLWAARLAEIASQNKIYDKLNPGSKLRLQGQAPISEAPGSRLQAPNILEIRSLARTKLNPCSKLGLWAARLAELASQNKTESRLQAWALGCKACRAC